MSAPIYRLWYYSRQGPWAAGLLLVFQLGMAAEAAEPAATLLATETTIESDEPATGNSASPLGQLPAWQSRIVQYMPDGTRRVLTESFYSACDPAVSFDARRMLFAGKRSANQPWNVFELSLDDLAVRQITADLGNCRQPGYQSTLYTIVSSEPWYQLTFVSDVADALNENGSSVATSLYSCKLDGSEVRRLTYNLSDDADPFLMLDGRILYASWQRSDLRYGLTGRVSLFGVNIDGTDCALFADTRGKPVKRMPCATDRGLVVFVESEFGGDGSGQLGSVTFRRPLHSYRPITQAQDGHVYRDPSPWPGGQVLVSRRAMGNDTPFAIHVLNPQTGRSELLREQPGVNLLQAIAVRVQREPDGRSSVVNEEDPHGKLYCLNVNIDDFANRSWHPPGTAHRVRFLEGVPLPAAAAGDGLAGDGLAGDGHVCPGSTRNGLPPVVQRRILGEVDLRPDGSFNVELPANTPVQLQTVDEQGMALRTCGWIWAKNREPRGCIGCHEDGELTPENTFVDAMKDDSIALTLPPQRRRTVDFRRDLMPIIERKCVSCHGADGAAPRLTHDEETADRDAVFNAAYRALLARDPGPQEAGYGGRYVDPGQARTSPLIWHLFGRNTSRPWDTTTDRPAAPIPPQEEEAGKLTELERRTFVEWIDMGALWDGIAGADDWRPAAE